MPAYLVHGMQGLGDSVYQRAFVRALPGDVYLATPWPELYRDLGVRFVYAPTRLRTQAKNLARHAGIWSEPPADAKRIAVNYASAGFERDGIWRAMERQFGVSPARFDLPDFGPCPVESDRPVAVVRPVTLRREWESSARAPLPEYVAQAAEILMETHHVVSVADVDGQAEWMLGLVAAHTRYERGELPVERLLALIQHADVVVGGVGWVVPACIASGTWLACILGGRGAHNAPEIITDPRMDTSRVGWFVPDDYCRCSLPVHDCDKRITDFPARFREWLSGRDVPTVGGSGAGLAP